MGLLILMAASSWTQTPGTPQDNVLEGWRAQRAAELSTADGWLSLVALEWLKPGETSVGSGDRNAVRLAHGPAMLVNLRQENGKVSVEEHDASLRLDGAPVPRGAVVAVDDGRAGQLRSGDLLLLVIRRGDRLYLRVKDARSPTRVHFRGLSWYPPEPRFRVAARWVPSATGHRVTVPNVLGQISQEPSPGLAEFVLDGKRMQLEPIQEEPGSLFFIFRDTTSRSTTYGAGRFLTTELPDHGLAAPGTVVLDFNRAVNPPCAYTPFATCPLPPAGNRLPVAIAAGEKRYAP